MSWDLYISELKESEKEKIKLKKISNDALK